MKIWTRSGLFLSAGLILGVGLTVLFSFDRDKSPELAEVKEEGRLLYKWYVPETPREISFAGEKVPLDRPDVREQLERELLGNYYGHTNMLYVLRQVPRYFPMIEAKLREYGIPEDFKYLCVAESSLINQTSRAGAVGFWQFMKDTAPRYGLEVNDEVDERYHVLKSTEAACKYLKEAKDKFGTWTAAAASYNCGQAGYERRASFQQTQYYYDLMLPEETMRYVFRILALKHLIQAGEKVGYMMPEKDAYKPFKTRKLIVTASVPDLAQFAIDNGVTYRTLKLYNPWLRAQKLTVKPGKTYEIELPVRK